MLLDTIATIILIGMMLIPFVNIVVGVVVGAGLGGVPGALLGLAAAIAITGAEKFAADHWQPYAPEGVGVPPEPVVAAPLQEPLGRRLRVRLLAPRKRIRPPGIHVPPSPAHTLH